MVNYKELVSSQVFKCTKTSFYAEMGIVKCMFTLCLSYERLCNFAKNNVLYDD
jgi:hypothetical protein